MQLVELGFIWALLIAFLLLAIYSIAAATGRMKCAEKLGLDCGWMAFLPFLRQWLSGRMGQRSDEICRPEKRHAPLGALYVLSTAFSEAGLMISAFLVLYVSGSFLLTQNRFLRNMLSFLLAQTEKEYMGKMNAGMAVALTVLFSTVVMLILQDVIGYISLYRVYRAFLPKRGGLLFAMTFLFPFIEPAVLLILGFGKAQAHLPSDADQGKAPPALPAVNCRENDRVEDRPAQTDLYARGNRVCTGS